MSRIGKKPILIPAGVDVAIANQVATVKGPKGTLTYTVHPSVQVEVGDAEGAKAILVTVADGGAAFERAIWGTTRANLANLVQGVTTGFTRALEVIGVGFKVNVQGKKVVLDVGYSHPVEFELPDGVTATVEKNTLTLSGMDTVMVGQTAANIRNVRKPEPYGGTGIKYTDEVVRRKAGKAAAKSE